MEAISLCLLHALLFLSTSTGVPAQQDARTPTATSSAAADDSASNPLAAILEAWSARSAPQSMDGGLSATNPSDSGGTTSVTPWLVVDFAPGTDPVYMQAMTEHLTRMHREVAGDTGTQEFTIGGRWPGQNGDPIDLLWSIMPDGIPDGFGGVSSTFATMDAQFAGAGGRAAWVGRFVAAFQRWDELTGINFQRIVIADDADDGAPMGADGAPALRGDIRVRTAFVDGPLGVLAFAQVPGTGMIFPGEITFDQAEDWLNTPWLPGAGFARASTHEIGHAVGLLHVCPTDGSKLMEQSGIVGNSLRGPQHDDMIGAQRLYGDPREPNDTFATATPIVLPPPPASPVNQSAIPANPNFNWIHPIDGLLSIDSPTDVDVFAITIPRAVNIEVSFDVTGLLPYPSEAEDPQTGQCAPPHPNINTEQAGNLHMELLDRTGTVVLDEGTSSQGGHVNLFAVLKVTNAPYFLRVSAASGSFFVPQCYEMELPLFYFNQSCGTCSDGNPTNGVESCSGDGCVVAYQSDCNGNFMEDSWDVAFGDSQDCNNDDVPDECQDDCNGNGRDDSCDIALGFSDDLDGDYEPDECEADCNNNSIVDGRDIQLGTSQDVNDNEVPDECESTWHVPGDFPTIRSAILNAGDGDKILIGPGTWTGPENTNLDVVDKTLQIVGENGAFSTTIDMALVGRGMVLSATTDPWDNRTTITGLTFKRGNVSNFEPFGSTGGALILKEAAVTVDRCRFIDNHATDGGAITVLGVGGSLIRSSFFWANIGNAGGAILVSGDSMIVQNCTFSHNFGSEGAAVATVNPGDGIGLSSCIVWGNTPADAQIVPGFGAAIYAQYCDLPVEHQAEFSSGPNFGNLFVNPLYLNAAAGDLHIPVNSPCKNAGAATWVGFPPNAKDIDGQPRFWQQLDIGADEFKQKFAQQQGPP